MTLGPPNPRSLSFIVPAAMLGLWLVVLLGGNGHLDALGNPLGGDFAMLHQAGRAASCGDWDRLYNEAWQQEQLVASFPGLPASTYLPYRYPPLTAAVLAPLGALPYLWAWFAFLALSVVAWSVSWRGLLSLEGGPKSPTVRNITWTLIFSPVLAQTLIDGQASLFWFAIAAGTYLNLERKRYVLAGAILALGALKPNVMALLAVMWIVRYPRLLLGLLPTGALLFLAMTAITGWSCLATYVSLARQLASGSWPVETPYWKVESLLSWTQMLVGDGGRQVNLIVGLALAVMLGIYGTQRARGIENADAAVLCGGLVVNALFNPYTPVYDLTLLSLGLFAILRQAEQLGHLESLVARRDAQVAFLCIWLGPIVSQNLSSALHCPQQVMPLWLAAIYGWYFVIVPSKPVGWHWQSFSSASG